MFERLGRTMVRRRWWVLGLAVAFIAFAGIWGTQVFGKLVGGGFDDPASESSRALTRAEAELGRDGNDVVVLYRSSTLTADDPAYQQAVTSTLADLPSDVVTGAATFWSTKSPTFVSKDKHETFAVLTLAGDDEETRTDQLEQIEGKLAAPGLESEVGGNTAINRDINERVSADIAKAETLSMPVLLILLVIIFGSLAAASLPLAVGGLAILGAFTALRGLSYLTDVSIFSVNVVTILGLGLAIDYGLFMVGRFREELARGLSVEDAVARTMGTAGRTVAVSGVTVAVSLAGLLIFPITFLRSMGLGGLSAVLIAMIAALTVLPALFGVLGHRVDALSVRRLFSKRRQSRRKPQANSEVEHGFWYRLARSIMRRPVIYTVGVLAVLLIAATPFLRVEFGGIDARALPAGTESRVVSETLDRDFVPNSQSPIDAIVTSSSSGLDQYVADVRTVDGVTGASVTAQSGDTARVSITYDGDPISAESRELVSRIREVPAPSGGEVLVGGQTAALADQLKTVGDRLPWMALIVVSATFVLLFLAFGSLVLPVKAIIMNVLSLGASFGALVLIFQEGHLSGLLNFTSTGTLEATQPILVLGIVFGLSMDYEVFLMSRMREEYDRTGDNTQAVAVGLQRSGRIITSAALLILVVIGLFSISGITFIKLIGVAMLIAVLVDATIVRALLVPATMRLLGNLNWWAPGPLRRFYARYGIHEEGTPTPPAPVPAGVGT
ncbi:MMPL family transporter [Cryptosporangium arvum]|uniref:Putative RND superfamily drug exporter n=1 Tax=Cryptosporangium arvum DSM 44712 TaxID=927661 RepID=A0A011AC47_9ACTN|nr:MMPL family transporter [Cryptosporangium arvum]EXG79611.1 putative RND superfamily drug exporter [Cryptosporangium arvum DSM 44712]